MNASLPPTDTPPSTHAMAARALAESLGVLGGPAQAAVQAALQQVDLPAGQMLFSQGDPSDAIYFLVRGRLHVLADAQTPHERLLGEVARGETVGEMGVISHLPRSASVRAARDCALLKLARDDFEALLSAHPGVGAALARLLALRLSRSQHSVPPGQRARTISLLGLNQAMPDRLREMASLLTQAMGGFGRVRLIQAEDALAHLRAHSGDDNPALSSRQASAWLDDVEAQCDWLLLCAPDTHSDWAAQCMRQSDETVWVADCDMPVARQLERLRTGLALRTPGMRSHLALFHPVGTAVPSETLLWQLDEHSAWLHLRPGHAGDMNRLARHLAGRSIGLTLSGGGARGFSHLGVYRALHEAGVSIDAVSGTSMGAAVASFIALGYEPERLMDTFRWIFSQRPTSDYNLFPVLSLVAGRRLRGILEHIYRDEDGDPLLAEDCWLPFHCVVSNFSTARMETLRAGPLSTLVRASMALPGLLPPVFHGGQTYIDGGVFNNLPTDVLRRHGVARVIAVDLRIESFGPSRDLGTPGAADSLRLWWQGRRGQGVALRVPTLREMLLRLPTLNSAAHQAMAADMADVVLRPDVGSVGLLDWSALERAAEMGYRSACEAIERGELEQLRSSSR